MTTFGKILTVFVFLCSLAVGALGVFLYTARVNFSVVATKWQQRAEAAEASEKSLRDENVKYQKSEQSRAVAFQKIVGAIPPESLDAQVSKLKNEIDVKDQEVASLKKQLVELNKNLLVEKNKNNEFNAVIQAVQLGLTQTLADKNKVRQQLKDAYDDIAKLQLAANKAREEKVKFEIEAIALRETNKQLESRGRDLAMELARSKRALQSGGTGTGVVALSVTAPNPPTHAIDGKVLDAAGDGLVEISVGSDAGLTKGHTMDAYRLGAKPQWLGMIRLITVEPTRSVGQVVGRPTAALQRGDNVSSKLIRAD